MTCDRCGTTSEDVAYSHALEQNVCADCYQQHAPPPVRSPHDFAVAQFTRYEQAQERKRAKERADLYIDTLAACEALATEASEAGRYAVIDPDLHIVVTECPHCPNLDWVPYQVVPRWDATVYRCKSCGYERVDDRRTR